MKAQCAQLCVAPDPRILEVMNLPVFRFFTVPLIVPEASPFWPSWLSGNSEKILGSDIFLFPFSFFEDQGDLRSFIRAENDLAETCHK
jgi:hypothetical protein